MFPIALVDRLPLPLKICVTVYLYFLELYERIYPTVYLWLLSKVPKRLRKGVVNEIVMVAAAVITIMIVIIVLAYFQGEASSQVSNLNNTQAQSAFNTATNLAWTSITLLAIGLLAIVGFAIIKVFRS